MRRLDSFSISYDLLDDLSFFLKGDLQDYKIEYREFDTIDIFKFDGDGIKRDITGHMSFDFMSKEVIYWNKEHRAIAQIKYDIAFDTVDVSINTYLTTTMDDLMFQKTYTTKYVSSRAKTLYGLVYNEIYKTLTKGGKQKCLL